MGINAFSTFLLCAALAVLCHGAAISPRITDQHNIDMCDVKKANIALVQEDIYEDAVFFGIAKRHIVFPRGEISKHVITCVKVTNTDPGNNGGYPKIISGGVGSTSVDIMLTSKFGQPLNFRVEIWAER